MEKVLIAKALVWNQKHELLLVRRSKTAPRRPLEWDFPGGFVDESKESFQRAAIRELKEETGLEALRDSVRLAFANSEIREKDGEVRDVSWLYFEMTTTDDKVQLSYEHDKAAWVSLEEAQQMIEYDVQLRALAYLQKRNEKSINLTP